MVEFEKVFSTVYIGVMDQRRMRTMTRMTTASAAPRKSAAVESQEGGFIDCSVLLGVSSGDLDRSGDARDDMTIA